MFSYIFLFLYGTARVKKNDLRAIVYVPDKSCIGLVALNRARLRLNG